MAARMLAALPAVAVAAWSGNAALLRLQHQSSAPLEFVAGSMDDAIMESLETGDVIFFSRRLAALQPLAAVHTAALRRQLDPRFDHCGWVFVDRLGRHFVVEETLGRVHCRPYAARVLSSEASEIAVLRLKAPRPKALQDAALAFVTANAGRASRSSLKQFVGALIDPNNLLAPVNEDQDDEQDDEQEQREVAFPSAAFVVEALDAMGLVDKARLGPGLSAANVTPRDLVAKGKLRFRPESGARFGSLVPIRLE